MPNRNDLTIYLGSLCLTVWTSRTSRRRRVDERGAFNSHFPVPWKRRTIRYTYYSSSLESSGNHTLPSFSLQSPIFHDPGHGLAALPLSPIPSHPIPSSPFPSQTPTHPMWPQRLYASKNIGRKMWGRAFSKGEERMPYEQ